MNRFYLKIGFLAIAVSVLVLAGCGGEESPSTVPMVNKKDAKSVAAVPSDESGSSQDVVTEKYVYNPLGKRDPFENPLKTIVEVAPDSGVPLTPLQKFDLGQLRLIGVIVGRGEPRGMVVAPDGKSFILKIGTKVGKNDGTVVDITTDSVQVKEKYYDFAGEVRTSVQEIRLPKQGGVK